MDGHDPAHGSDAHLDTPLLLQGGVDAERAQLGILLRAADEVHGGEVHLAHAPRPAGKPVGEALLLALLLALFEPPAEDAEDVILLTFR